MSGSQQSMQHDYRILPAGDSALTVELGATIDAATNDRVLALARAVEKRSFPGVIEVVPTYRSVTIYVDAARTDMQSLEQGLREAVPEIVAKAVPAGRSIEIPVLYSKDFGLDLPDIAAQAKLSPEKVIALHTSVEYRVYMLGFSPGFPYLGTVPEQIAVPRLPEPRFKVPAGSVGIAGSQTGIYPQESPGGWRLIGRTPWRLYDPARPKPFLLEPGDHVKFVAISAREYERMAARTQPSDSNF